MAFISAPCLTVEKKNLMTPHVSMLLKPRVSLTCFRACFFPGRAKDLSAPRYVHYNLKVHSEWSSLSVWVHLQAAAVTAHISISTLIRRRTCAILRTGNDRWVGRFFYITKHSLMMNQWGPKHVEVCVLKHYCNPDEMCAFVDHTVTNES